MIQTTSNNAALGEARQAPASVVIGVTLFGASFLVALILIAVGDRSSLTPGVGDTVENTLFLFSLAHLLLIPLISLPIWGVQGVLLWKTFEGNTWARLLLLASTLALTYFAFDLTELKSIFSPNSPYGWSAFLGHSVPIVLQLVALVFFFRTGEDWFSTKLSLSIISHGERDNVYRYWFGAVSILFIVALFAPSQDITLHAFPGVDSVEIVHGYFWAAIGWLGPLQLRFAWFANIPLAACAMKMAGGYAPRRRWALCAAGLSLTVFLPGIILDVGRGGHFFAYARGPAVWLWLSTFAVTLVAAFIRPEEEDTQDESD
jgi:hypothetical protein